MAHQNKSKCVAKLIAAIEAAAVVVIVLVVTITLAVVVFVFSQGALWAPF